MATKPTVIQAAQSVLGTPYSWGGGGPDGASYGIGRGAGTKGFDCSGLIQYAFSKIGVTVGGDTFSQWKQGIPVPESGLKPGDAVFFEKTAAGPGHVALYIGDGKVIAAPRTGTNVQVQTLADVSRMDGYVGARRYAPPAAAVSTVPAAVGQVGAASRPQPATLAHQYFSQVLTNLGIKPTGPRINYLQSWSQNEGTAAINNPLATTQHSPGSYDLPGNSAHVQQYPTLEAGAKATAQTLRNGYYPGIVQALKAADPFAAQQSIPGIGRQLSTWSGSGYTAVTPNDYVPTDLHGRVSPVQVGASGAARTQDAGPAAVQPHPNPVTALLQTLTAQPAPQMPVPQGNPVSPLLAALLHAPAATGTAPLPHVTAPAPIQLGQAPQVTFQQQPLIQMGNQQPVSQTPLLPLVQPLTQSGLAPPQFQPVTQQLLPPAPLRFLEPTTR